MIRSLFIIMAVSLGLNAGLLYVRYMDRPTGPFPEGHERPGKERGAQPGPEMIVNHQLKAKTEHLGLDNLQQEKIRVILEENLPRMVEFRQRTEEAQAQMSALYGQAPFDEAAFLSMGRLAAQSRTSADSLSAVILSLEAEVLTDQQRKSFAEVAPMHQMGPEGPRGAGRPGGPSGPGGPPRDGRPPRKQGH